MTLGRLQLHFIDRSRDTIDALGTFVTHAQTMIQDIAGASGLTDTGSPRFFCKTART